MSAHRPLLNLKLLIILMALTLARSASPVMQADASGPAADPPLPPTIEAFDLVSASAGWLLLDQRLYWTTDNGAAWADITPPDLGPATIRAVAFSDSAHGGLVLTAPTETGDPLYRLARTDDGGHTWQDLPLALFTAGDPAALADKLSLQWLDTRTGWLVVKRATSRNFSQGTLFRTDDGGRVWTRLTLPIGERVSFQTRALGWVVGGAAGDESYQTSDGGETWQRLSAQRADRSAAVEAALGVSNLRWATPDQGWAEKITGRCDPAAPDSAPRCASTEQLISVSDGGRIWRPVNLPERASSRAGAAEAPAALFSSQANIAPQVAPNIGGRTRAITGQGVDACPQPSLTQMNDWVKNSPYRVWNLYIGGVARGNCGALTAGYIAALAVQGWRFTPTWVGPQAPCAGFAQSMSLDPTLAHAEGVAEANAAVERAAGLGLTFADKTGSVIYYDLEAYDIKNAPCRAAAQAFIAGWSVQLRARGQLAGVYGASCTSALSDFTAAGQAPDVIWAAYWLLPYQYRSNASVWDLPCLSNTLWTNSQRLRQYSGGHNEAWGATTLNIDSSVLDGRVADLLSSPLPAVNPLELYLEPDYAGLDVCFAAQAGWFNVSGCAPGWEAQISSLKLQPGWSARVYRDPNLGGPNLCFVLDDPNLANDHFDAATLVDNHISSLKLYQNTSCAEPVSPHTLFLPQVNR